MATYVSLSREAFQRGVRDALELRPLRDAAKAMTGNASPSRKYTSDSTSTNRSVVVKRSAGGNWYVKKAS